MTRKDAEKGARVLNWGSRNGRGLTYVEGAHVLRTSQSHMDLAATFVNTEEARMLRVRVRRPRTIIIIHAQNAVDRASILLTCVSRTSHLSPRKLWDRKLMRKLKR